MATQTDALNEAVISKLIEIRQIRGLSQKQLALKAKIAQSYVCELEKNAYHPTLDILVRICAVLDVSLSEVMKEAERSLNGGSFLPSQKLFESLRPKKFTIGQELKLVRRSRRQTQELLSNKTRISKFRISMIERDAVTPTVDELYSLCSVIGISMQEFLTRVQKRTSKSRKK